MKMRKYSSGIFIMFLITILIPATIFAQAAVPVMTLANGTTVSMTSAQLTALASQPGVALSASPVVTAAQVAVPLPASLGGGFMVAEPAALAAGMNTVGITTGATAAGVAGATTSAGAITAGASVAGATAAGGVGAGTIAAGAAAAAAAAAVAAEASRGTTTTPAHH
jgi:hypothetical protein